MVELALLEGHETLPQIAGNRHGALGGERKDTQCELCLYPKVTAQQGVGHQSERAVTDVFDLQRQGNDLANLRWRDKIALILTMGSPSRRLVMKSHSLFPGHG
jgi:hypothetical protein